MESRWLPISKQAEALSLTTGVVDQATTCWKGCSFKMMSGCRLQSGSQAGVSAPCPRPSGVSELVVVRCPLPCREPSMAEHGFPALPVQLRLLLACAWWLEASDWINSCSYTTGCDFCWPRAGWKASLWVPSSARGWCSESLLEVTQIPGCRQRLSPNPRLKSMACSLSV